MGTPTQTLPPFLRKGVNAEMFATMLQLNPATIRIETALTFDNRRILDESFRETANCLQAMQSTPAYAVRVRVGFSKIVEFDCSRARLVVER